MKKIELIEGSVSSVLGFGCGPILGSVDHATATRALEYAIANGINHFDLARSYGYGEAEEFFGRFIKANKNQIVVATKFGIRANQLARVFRYLKPVIRTFQKRNTSNKKPQGNAEENRFSKLLLQHIEPLRGKHMRENLEESLKALQRDYVDHYFIHEPWQQLIYIEELLETAHLLKKEGKIKSIGLAYRHSQFDLHKDYLKEFDILQFNSPVSLEGYGDLRKDRGMENNIIFSLFRGNNPEISPANKLKNHLSDFPNSVLLISMFNINHIKQNIEIADSLERNAPEIVFQ